MRPPGLIEQYLLGHATDFSLWTKFNSYFKNWKPGKYQRFKKQQMDVITERDMVCQIRDQLDKFLKTGITINSTKELWLSLMLMEFENIKVFKLSIPLVLKNWPDFIETPLQQSLWSNAEISQILKLDAPSVPKSVQDHRILRVISLEWDSTIVNLPVDISKAWLEHNNEYLSERDSRTVHNTINSLQKAVKITRRLISAILLIEE